MKYILSIDQSTQATKALIFDEQGAKIAQISLPHKQIINACGWVEHDLNEILENTLTAVRLVVNQSCIDKSDLVAVGITNQRETVAAWERSSGKPLYNAIVWQCARAQEQCDRIKKYSETIKLKTGMNLSPYFSAAKMAWLIENVADVKNAMSCGDLCLGTIDSFLISHLTNEKNFYTEYSNASRTQLLNINTCVWDDELCEFFGIPLQALPQIKMSDSIFGYTDFGGLLDKVIPICGVLGDSQSALFGQQCVSQGQIKVTYGTGSSIMMQTEKKKIVSESGLVSSIAWGIAGNVNYVLEGNLNYTGAVIEWMKSVGWITEPEESEECALNADSSDVCYLVPAFSGLGAPYWNSSATGMLTGITRRTGRNEMVKAGLECIALQINDIILLMKEQTGFDITEIRADGGPVANKYLMQFQSSISNAVIAVSDVKELSAWGVAYLAGKVANIYKESMTVNYNKFNPAMKADERNKKILGWKKAVKQVLIK